MDNLFENALTTVQSHEEMNEVIEKAMKEAKEFKKNIKALSEDEEKALVAFISVYVHGQQGGANPLHVFEVLKRNDYKFKGMYAPLNNVLSEQIVKFIFSDGEELEELEQEFEHGDYVVYETDNGKKYMEIIENADEVFTVYSEQEGEYSLVAEKIDYVVTDKNEKIVAEICASWVKGEEIHVYHNNFDEVVYVPLFTDGGHSMLLMDKGNSTLYNKVFQSITQLAWHIVEITEDIEAVEVY